MLSIEALEGHSCVASLINRALFSERYRSSGASGKMGGGGSKKREAAIFTTSKADADLQRVMESLQVEDKDLKALIKMFCKIDKSGDDQISQHEMFKHFKLECGSECRCFAHRGVHVSR